MLIFFHKIDIHSEKDISILFHIKRNVILATVFLLILNQTEFRLIDNYNQKINSNYVHISFNLREIRNKFFRM